MVGPTKPVKVVNTPSEPVPVTGTVNVGNLGDGPLPVRDVDNPARQPFQASNSSIQAEGTHLSTVTVATVPAGKRLVIEFVSARGELPPGST